MKFICLSNFLQVDSFCVGDKVKAVWSGNKTKYDATVLEKHNNGELFDKLLTLLI